MALSDSKRYLQRLLDALTDDGLEDLTLRLVKPDYPDAHRIRGNDGGIDVFSDHEEPPTRGWQAKNYKKVPWGECRDSLKAAMENYKPPHYTFVFPFELSKGQRDFWVKTFYPEQSELYPNLELDYIDDLAAQLEGRPDLVELLSDGAFGDYIRGTLKQTAETGVSPVARASDLIADPIRLAEHAMQIGKNDPNFSYGYSAREARGSDQEITDKGVRFTMSHKIEDLPEFKIAIREGDRVTELHADARPDAALEAPEPHFDATPEGEEARVRARISLSKGEPIEFDDESVAIKPGAVPDRFYQDLTDGLLRNGIVGLGLSEPVDLEITLVMDGEEKGVSIPLYRIPGEADDKIGWGGSYGGTLIMLDFKPAGGPDDKYVELTLGLTLGVDGMRGVAAITGLGFAQAFERAERIRLVCPELLPVDGLEFPGEDGDRSNQEAQQVAATLAGALTLLERRDGRARLMPKAVSESDYFSAQMTVQVLTNRAVEIDMTNELLLPVPQEFEEAGNLEDLLDTEIELPPIAGQTTGVMVRRQMVDVEAIEIVEGENGIRYVRLRPIDGSGRIVVTLPS